MNTDCPEFRYCIAVWETSADGLSMRASNLTVEEFTSLTDALAEAQTVDMNVHFRAAEQNKQALDGLISALDRRRRVPVDQRQHTPNSHHMQTRFLVLLANFLSSVRAYFDGTADAIAQRHGKESDAYLSFKQTRADAYDSSPEYRFFEQLRNVIQHSANLPLQIDAAAVGDTSSARMRLRADKTSLLESSVRWKETVRADIEQGPDSRDIADDLNQYWEEFVAIERSRVAVAARDAVGSMRLLHDVLERTDLTADKPSALVRLADGDIQTMHWGWSRNQYARNIELALAGEAHNPAPPVAQPSTAPSGVTEQARDVMTAWLVEGPDAAAETLNDLAQTDDGIEATVIGLVNMTAVSLYQVQAVLGHDIHTLLAEMVDPPADTDG